ncbi:MAG: response regulator [Brevundimonas sp.]|uniref:response regulator transcription factor n=1 Tax=Brevundimonas sp. TaxID=1871086 RepID=UPI0025645976|nr:response regulator [Brevundimonas sp.]MDK2748429.1 response regulator [Brevundimonas sp.]
MPSSPLIAIIDDDGMVRASLTRLLRSMGLRVLGFDSAEVFLAGSIHLVDCIISDMQMPGMSGLALQQQVLVDRPDLPVIFITAYPDEPTRSRALTAGAVCYLEKPCSADALSRCLDRALTPEPRVT